MTRHRIYVNGRVHVRARQCSTCIFGPRSPVSQERVDGMIAGATADDAGSIPCHHHLYEDAAVEPVCHGFYVRHATLALRLASLLDVIEWVE